MSSPFDFINTINQKTEQLEMDEVGLKDYVPFMINRGLSFNMQTVLFANEMNKCSGIPKEWQYDFLYHAVPKGKRYDKWVKADKTNAQISLIKDFFHINNQRASEVLQILSEDQISMIRKKLDQGGRR